MPLNSGEKLGPYEILSPLGAGGMGEVYRARDSKLGRDVALKVLPEEFAQHRARLARFQREARLLASLNHPNIAAIYGLEESAGVLALVMELVEGRTLGDLIAGKPMPIGEALPIARQIAEALEFAHEKGIIHRDLKPANIQLTQEHQVKILDFGLAKALEGGGSQANISDSPTLPAEATQSGVIVGTPTYMSPEQAQGKAVDRRADIWAFGCVLYEMLTGKRAVEGETVSDTLASVLKAEPDWSALPQQLPAPLGHLLRRCLTKDPKQRLRDIGEVRIAMEEAMSGSAAPVSPPAAESRLGALQRVLPWAVSAIVFIAAALVVSHYWRAASLHPLPVYSYILPPEKTTFDFRNGIGAPVLSPDGTKLIFAADDSSGNEMLWIRRLDSPGADKLPGTEGASFPFWSPDSRFVAYFVPGKLMKMDASGGPPQAICDAPSGRGGTWNADGVIVFAPQALGRSLYRVSAAGGNPVSLIAPDAKNLRASSRWPVFLPDGRHFVYWSGYPADTNTPQNSNGIYLASLDGKHPEFLLPADSDALYSPPGYLLYLQGLTLMAQPFDARALKLAGSAFPVAEEVANPPNFRFGNFSVSASGDLVFESGGQVQDQVGWVDASGKQLGAVGEPGIIDDLRLSPSGKFLVEAVTAGPQSRASDLWIEDLARGIRTRFTFDPWGHEYPVWSPDETKIAFSSERTGVFDIFVKPAIGTGAEQVLVEDSDPKYVNDWSRDGRYIAYMRLERGKTGWDIWILPLSGDKKPFPFLASPFNETDAAFSPDGKWLAYTSDESARNQVYVVPFPQGNGKWQISSNGGHAPRWRQDGKELYYHTPDRKLMAVAMEVKNGSPVIGDPRFLFLVNTPAGTGSQGFGYDVTADGKKFAVLTEGSKFGTEPLTLMTNWTADLKK